MKDILKIIKAAKRFSKTHCNDKHISISIFRCKKDGLKKAFKKLNPDIWEYRNGACNCKVLKNTYNNTTQITFFT